MQSAQRIERSQACLFGGAIGDALGAPVGAMDWPAIRGEFGESGAQALAQAYGGLGRVTGDTQLMLFTAEGMLRGYVRIQERDTYAPGLTIHHALIRWLTTQGMPTMVPRIDNDAGLIGDPHLHARRSPSVACIDALSRAPAFGWQAGGTQRGGGVMRIAPIGLFPWGDFLLYHRERAFQVACESLRLTHAYPGDYLAAGVFAYLINGLLETRHSLESLMLRALTFMDSGAGLNFHPGVEERRELPRSRARIRFLLEAALDFHRRGIVPSPQGIDVLCNDRGSEELLAIGIWCALMAGNYRQGVLWAVNHSAASSTAGLIAGHLLGLRFGLEGLPPAWLEALELRDWLDRLAHDLQWLPRVYRGHGHGAYDAELNARYPGW
ncbi:ADP-ribosylglycohydrolase [Modicisalibacter muralis]|uniref:ADP-ribosylglycohydrolase n=1 Tax=Modicisalibacter muralis TaxID=119000 RepID=A0A1G9PDR5_9GAMM|nr:ADP-ribosylglycohydrolase family protein [Halomonas muralis]SDL96898.1 ADP-ribosylglycohydrolase [Halomonas muralis]